MTTGKFAGAIAVIFVSQRTRDDEAGYARAAETMAARAAAMPGYRGIHSARGPDGHGVTISYWADEASARAWRDDPEHARIRELGRARWYESYELIVAEVTRAHDWHR